jgi:hypothetical protein
LLTYFLAMIKKELKTNNLSVSGATSAQMGEVKKTMQEKLLAALMLNGVNQDRYGELKRSIAKNYGTKTGAYPKSPEAVLHILNAYFLPAGWKKCIRQDVSGEEGAMLAQSDNDSWKKNIKCHNWGKKGHLVWECHTKSDKKGDGTKNKDQVHANVEGDKCEDKGENIFVHSKKSVVNQNCLLLDNQSTVNQVANASLLKNISKLDKPMVVHCVCVCLSSGYEGGYC